MRTFAEIECVLESAGLKSRGGFSPNPEDGVPTLPDGREAAAVILAGNAGPGMWYAFSQSPEAADGAPDPLDRWSRRVLSAVARQLGGHALFPFGGPPYLPFQRWALRAEPLHSSPLGVLIHPLHGLWHAYRGGLAFAEPLDLPPGADRPSPCAGCPDKPCLSACPVAAFSKDDYDVPTCVKHITGSGGQDCLDSGCRARRACPVGQEAVYEPAQARFHMAAFLDARLKEIS